MEVKEWDKYSEEEKKNLLKHWWYYYGKLVITLGEQERFEQLVERDLEQIMDVALFAFLFEQSSQTLIYAMRQNRLKEFFDVVNASMNDIRLEEDFCDIKKEFISMLVESYNHPEPDVPMKKEELDKQLRDMGRDPNRVVYIRNFKL